MEDTLTTHGYNVSSEVKYVKLANEIASYRSLTTTLAVVGLLIVAISMAGLASALTTSVLERTREIGILRSIGARARHIRRIFATETVALAATGWLIGIPIGYLVDRFLVWLVKTVVNIDVPFTFPLWNLVLALAGTILLALLITLAPIRRPSTTDPATRCATRRTTWTRRHGRPERSRHQLAEVADSVILCAGGSSSRGCTVRLSVAPLGKRDIGPWQCRAIGCHACHVRFGRKIAGGAGMAAVVYGVWVRPRLWRWGATDEEVAGPTLAPTWSLRASGRRRWPSPSKRHRIRSGRGLSRWAVIVAVGTPGTASTMEVTQVPSRFTRSGRTWPWATT
jgi:FtsX-like permease family